MNLLEAKSLLTEAEGELAGRPFLLIQQTERNGRKLNLCLTDRLRRIARKGRVWKSNAFLTALKNVEYGFVPEKARSRGGSDGIFLLDRNFSPSNEMMSKIFDRYLDHEKSGVVEIANELKTKITNLQAVRLVSHHMRILGVLHETDSEDWLILVDYDNSK